MSFIEGIFGGGGSQSKQQAQAAGIQSQTSVAGKPIPLVYGTTRIAPNFIWYGDFNAVQQNSGGGAGKGGIIGGGGGKGGGSGEYQYYASFIGALCEGPINLIGKVWVNKSTTNIPSLGLTVVNGTIGQAAWGYLASQTAVTAETWTIPSTPPYQITVNQAALFVIDDGVYQNNTTTFANSGASSPGNNQYNLKISYNTPRIIPEIGNRYSNVTATYTFNSSNAGQYVNISYSLTTVNSDAYVGFSSASSYYTSSATVPSSAPYTVTINASANSGTPNGLFVQSYANESVIQTAQAPFTVVSSSPGNDQYDVSTGIYTFASSNKGQSVVISYYANGNEPVALAYNGIAYIAAANYSLGNSPQLPNFNVEMAGFYASSTVTGYDADPSLVVYDLLTNTRYGAGVPSSNVGSLSTYQAYCIASGLWISPYYDSQTTCQSMFDDLAKATNSAVVWASGLITLVPYGDTAITANGYTYTPPSSPLYSLTDNDFMKNTYGTSNLQSDNPVQITRKRASDAYNSIKLEFLDRELYYQPAIAQATNLALINQYGLRQDATRTFHMFCDGNAAQLSCTLQLQREQIRNVYSFCVDQRYITLDPMDIIAVTDSYLGLTDQWVRILTITENDDMSLSITAEEYLDGNGNAPLYNYEPGAGYLQNYNQTAGNVNTPIFFEPPAEYQEDLEVIMGVCGSNLFGGCQVWVSTDGTTYQLAGTITGPNRMGVLTAALPSVTEAPIGDTIDTSSTLSVNLTESFANLGSASQVAWSNLQSLCYVQGASSGELIAYENANLTTAYNYNLTNLIRGCYGSTIATANIGANFLRLDSNVFVYPYNGNQIGNTIGIKLLSFNLWGGAIQELADVMPYYYTLQGTAYTSPLPDVTDLVPTYTGYVAGTTSLSWSAVSDFRNPDYEVRQGSSWSTANFLYRTPNVQGPISGDNTYWVAAHFKAPNNGPDVYSQTPTSLAIIGSQVTLNPIITYDAAGFSQWGNTGGWPGAFTNTVITSLGLQLNAAGNILNDPDYLNTANILYYGGVASSGTYAFLYGAYLAEPTFAQIIISMGTEVGYSINAVNILNIADYLNAQNILGVDLGNNTSATSQIQIYNASSGWSAWQNWVPGTYYGSAFAFQVLLETLDPTVLPVLTDITMQVDVNNLVQNITNQSISSGGTTINFPLTFNAGPGGILQPVSGPQVPNIQVQVLNASSGDTPYVTNKTVSSVTVQILNSGVGVARTVDIVCQGC